MALPQPPKQALKSPAEALTPLIQTTYTTPDLNFYLNGTKVVLSNPNPEWTLLDFIRSQHGLKGTKLGCGEGGCGACTIVLQTRDSSQKGRVRHLAVNACLFPLVGVDGKHVITIEGLGNVENPHPLQERIAKMHGSQCGFCTPGIVMSLYALVRNSYDPEKQEFNLSERDIEMEGHLDGNLCRCTGYKPILQAARTFVTEDLKGRLAKETSKSTNGVGFDDGEEIPYRSESSTKTGVPSSRPCGRPGGCCRDDPSKASCGSKAASSPEESSDDPLDSASSKSADESSSSVDTEVSGAEYAAPLKGRNKKPEDVPGGEGKKVETHLDAPPPPSKKGVPQYKFKPYSPTTELIFPPALFKYEKAPVCYGNSKKLWFRPTTLQQLVELKSAYPSAKLVAGASEVQVEIRFKNSEFKVSVYVSDIDELSGMKLPTSEAELASMKEFVIGANTPLTDLEYACKDLYSKLGQRGLVLEACRKQLRYFAGRQIRNVASLAGNIATASPISDMNPVLLASGASVVVQNQDKGAFSIPLSELFIAYRTTAIPPDAVITQIRIPLPPEGSPEVIKAYKQAKRKDDDIAIVTAAFRIRLDTNGRVEEASFAYGGMAPKTVEAKICTAALKGKKWTDPDTLEAGMDALAEEFNLSYSVPGGMASYRRTLTISMFFRFWHEAIAELKLGQVDPEIIQEIHREISQGRRLEENPNEQRIVGKQIPHLSALKQNTGEAEYIDDMPRQDRELFGAMVLSSKAHAKIISVDWTPALSMPGVLGYVDKHSIPKEANLWGSYLKDEPFFADGEVLSHGQPIGLIYAESALEAQAASRLVKVVYEELPAILTIDEAIEAGSWWKQPIDKILKKGLGIEGKMDEAFSKCDHIFEGVSRIGGQEHFYLETNAAMVIPHAEDGTMEVWSSTQNTMEVQEFVSQVTGVPSNRINSRVKRMGGGFGGKESRACQLASLLAVAAKKERRPMRAMLNRDEDMMTSGQRHPIQCRWKVGVSKEGKLQALKADVYVNAGYSVDMSAAVGDRAMTHMDNCYDCPNVYIKGYLCKTNIHSNTAFRGFGGPQGMYFAESYMSAIAEGLGIDIDELRLKNLYGEGGITPHLQVIGDIDWHVPIMLEQLRRDCKYEERKAKIREFNAKNKWKKRGISMIPTKFGLSFATAVHLNQATAVVRIYADGSILLHHGGTEMGQGLYTKMCQIAAQELNVPLDAIYTQDTASYQTANVSPTAASSGSDLNGMAVKNACDKLNERLQPYRQKYGPDAPMKTIAHAAYMDRVSLQESGFWKMPKIGYKWGIYDIEKVTPLYYYFTQGVACSEVELDLLTGDHTVLRTDILMDVGNSINPAIDYGQIEGAFVQGLGLYTMEETLWTLKGELATRGPGTYKIPGFSDIPQEFNVSLLRVGSDGKPLDWKHLRSIQSSKGIGEPPLFLGSTVFFALREAVRAARLMNGKGEGFTLHSPATAEKLRMSLGDRLAEKAMVLPKDGERNFFVAVA